MKNLARSPWGRACPNNDPDSGLYRTPGKMPSLRLNRKMFMSRFLTVVLAANLLLLPCAVSGAADGPTNQPRPNILFAIADDMSHASAYGHKFLSTPNFDRVAKQGILFNRAYTPSSKCAPSRSVIITGRNPWQLEEAANHQPYFPKTSRAAFIR